MEWKKVKSRFAELKGRQEYLKERLTFCDKSIEERKGELGNIVKARWVLNVVAENVQSYFVEQTESLVTSAIKAVFDRPFEFKVHLDRKRNRVECNFSVAEGDVEYFLKDEMGGGIIDIVSFALRVVFWSLSEPRTRPVFVLDEPMKYVGELIDRAGRMIKEISDRLGVQMIINTHDPKLVEIADKAWLVTHDDKLFSEVTLYNFDNVR